MALPDVFRNRVVTEVTPLALDSVYGELRAAGASEHSTCRRSTVCCRQRSTGRCATGWMVANPCLQATKPKVDTDEIEPPPPEWVRQLIAEAEGVNEDLAVCLRLAATTGARRGELVAHPLGRLQGQPPDDPPVARRVGGSAVRAADEDRLEGSPNDRGGHGDDASDRRASHSPAGGRRRARAARTRLRVLARRRRHAVAARTTCRSPVAGSPSTSTGCTISGTITPLSCWPPASRSRR